MPARMPAMTDDDKPETITLAELRAAIEPFRCGQSRCGERTGSLHGIPFFEHLEKIAAAARESLPLDASNQLEIAASLSRFKTDFRELADVLEPAQRNALCVAIADVAFIMSFGTPESLAVLRSSIRSSFGRHAVKAKGSPVADAVDAALAELGPTANVKSVQKFFKEKVPSPRLIYRRKKAKK
jgi:hypothetical protein